MPLLSNSRQRTAVIVSGNVTAAGAVILKVKLSVESAETVFVTSKLTISSPSEFLPAGRTTAVPSETVYSVFSGGACRPLTSTEILLLKAKSAGMVKVPFAGVTVFDESS